MDKILVKPLEKINDLNFGTDREEVRKYFGNNFKEFKKSKFSPNTTDAYDYFHIFYDENNKFEAIEIFDDVIVSIEGVTIFPNNIKILKEISDDFKKQDYSYISKNKSIGVHAPNDKMESILIAIEGYYI